MTAPGKKLRVSREITSQVAAYLIGGFRPCRRSGVRLPAGDASPPKEVRPESEARRIGLEIQRQLDIRRKLKSGHLSILLPRADVRWLGRNLPFYRLLAPPPAYALGVFGYLCRVEAGRRRGRRWIWPEARRARFETACEIPPARERTFRRDNAVLRRIAREEADDAKNPI